jgi:acetyl-CoA C-acetyltransferase
LEQAGVKLSDMSFAEVHDCFTIAELLVYEAIGLAPQGQGARAIEDGSVYKDGKLPINRSGGLKAKGHPIGATGAAQIAEIVTQLRGEAGPRQVERARTGLTHTLGGNTATVLVSLFGRD